MTAPQVDELLASIETSIERVIRDVDRYELLASIERVIRDVVRDELAGHVEPRLLSVQVAARALGISETACWELVSAGRLRSIKVGRRRLIPTHWLDRFVDQLEQAAS